jgi:hypothetical protein
MLSDMPTGDENDNEANTDLFRRGLAKLAKLLEWFRQSRLPRKLGLCLSWLILLIIGSVSGIWASNNWMQLWSKTAASDEFAFATLAIAFFAGVFALLAYQVSTGTPDLELGIMLYMGRPYEHELVYTTDSERRKKLADWFSSPDPSSKDPKFLWDDPNATDHIAYMWIDNKSRYPAKSPAVIMRFGNGDGSSMGLCWNQPESYSLDGPWKDKGQGPAWKGTAFKTSATAVLAAQWDGGSEYPIHGKSSRRLPDLALVSLFSSKMTNKFKAELLAENYRKVVDVTIEFKLQDSEDDP